MSAALWIAGHTHRRREHEIGSLCAANENRETPNEHVVAVLSVPRGDCLLLVGSLVSPFLGMQCHRIHKKSYVAMQDSTGRSETRNTTKGVLVTQLYVGMNTSFDT